MEQRSSTERLLIEILFQLVNRDSSSDGYVRERLTRAGLSEHEIVLVMGD